MLRFGKYALGAAAVVVAVLMVRGLLGARDAEWNARVEREMDRAQVALGVNAGLRVEASELQALADSLRTEASRRDTVILKEIVSLPAPPAECESFTLPRDRVIFLQGEQITTLRTENNIVRQRAELLRRAEILARSSADSMLALLQDRPRPLSPLIPSIGLGATAGVCTTGQPCVAIGLTLSWEVKLF